ncbi:MAG: NAD-dependent epimerase/dehydratase family protein [Pseudomonadota bacterium]
MRYLVTGSAGFIGNHVALTLLERGHEVLGVDNLNSYYDPRLKAARRARLTAKPSYQDAELDIADAAALAPALDAFQPERILHLAAQAGVRYSVENPTAYADSNLVGFTNILEAARAHGVDHLVYASTSSVYGANARAPFEERHGAAHPLSFYAATKRANEAMAHAYAHLFKIPCTGLRFFTVYGPWGRPDMALFKFPAAMLEGRPIDVYNNGQMARDFTYIDDIVGGVLAVADHPARPAADHALASAAPDPDQSGVAPHRLFNIGRGAPVELMAFIRVLEEKLGRKAEINFMPMQPGDVAATCASTDALEAAVGYRATTPVEEGVSRFVDWYRKHYGV